MPVSQTVRSHPPSVSYANGDPFKSIVPETLRVPRTLVARHWTQPPQARTPLCHQLTVLRRQIAQPTLGQPEEEATLLR